MTKREHIESRISDYAVRLIELDIEERLYGPNRATELRREMVLRGVQKWRKELANAS